MKTATKIVVVAAVVAMAWAGPGLAQERDGRGNNRCDPAGTWFGQNETYGLEFLVTIIPMGGGCYSTVVEGVANDIPPWEYSTAWRGVIQKTGPRSYSWVQLQFAGPSQATDPAEGVPDVAAAEGELNMVDCNHFDAEFDTIGIYAWGQIPFVDDPVDSFPPSIASYTRLPGACAKHNADE